MEAAIPFAIITWFCAAAFIGIGIFAILLSITMVFGMTITTFATSQPINISLNGTGISNEVYVNEEKIVMVPLRQISGKLLW